MKQTIIILLSMFLLTAYKPAVNMSKEAKLIEQTEQQVYLCTGKYSKRYHKNKTCRGLKACKGRL